MLIIRNIGELVVVPAGPIGGRSMRQVERIPSAAVVCDGQTISWFGREPELPPGGESGTEDMPTLLRGHGTQTETERDPKEIDACGGCVVPGLMDCHTHTVFAGTREAEFVQRIEGKSYAQIAEAGGGIRVTVDAVRNASVDELVQLALPRLERMLRNGVTTAEIKSGYGLSVADEFKMLEAIARLRALQPIELTATYLAAHTTPREFAGKPDEYLSLMFDDKVLARIRDEKLAEFCDVFCERTAFDLEQSRRVLSKAARFGLRLKVHADQITQMGASRLAAEVGAVSADHLEKIDDGGIAALKQVGCVAVVLPACSFFLGVEQALARKMLEANLPVAIATDYNPGSSMVESLPLAMTIACTQMRMTPIEALVAATANAAAAIGRQDRVGAIARGRQADLLVLDVPNLDRWLYEPGRNCVRMVIKKGRIVH